MKNNLLKFIPILTLLSFVPAVAYAQIRGRCGIYDGATAILCKMNEILNAVIPVLIALGVVYFVWGVVMYVIADGEEAKKKGRDQIIYGIIGLTVIVVLWGLVYILANTFGLGRGNIAPGARELNNLLPQ